MFGKALLGIDLKVDSDTGTSGTDNLTSDTTPTFTLAGFGSGEVVVTADHTSEQDVVVRRNGNGDVTMTALSDGVWVVTAAQGADTASITITVQADLPTLAVGNIGQTIISRISRQYTVFWITKMQPSLLLDLIPISSSKCSTL